MSSKFIFGFHAVTTRLRQDAKGVHEVYVDEGRHDKRMVDFIHYAQASQVRVISAQAERLTRMVGGDRHQGVVAHVEELVLARRIDELLDMIEGPPLLLVLDGVTDPHNLGACLRAADGAGVHAIIAPKDRAVGINATVSKVSSGAAETIPYIMVTNLARTLRELKEHDIWVVGTDDSASETIYQTNWAHHKGVALVMGSEGQGMRALTQKQCDHLVSIPMLGSLSSLNVAMASGIVLYEIRRQWE